MLLGFSVVCFVFVFAYFGADLETSTSEEKYLKFPVIVNSVCMHGMLAGETAVRLQQFCSHKKQT